jgi:hypothetical protein
LLDSTTCFSLLREHKALDVVRPVPKSGRFRQLGSRHIGRLRDASLRERSYRPERC